MPTPKRLTFTEPPYLARMIPSFRNPGWITGEAWRMAVRAQPIFPICRDTIVQRLLAFDWIVLPRDTSRRKELRSEIDYYTKVIEHADDESFDHLIDKVFQDSLDMPFGGIAEVVHWNTQKNLDGTPRVYGVFHIDGATCYPTHRTDYPVMQMVPGEPKPVMLEKGKFARIMYNPRPEIYRRGYGMAPPEKVYLALELLTRGDKYYANLLTDTPEAGILDLMDMDEETASNWLESFRSLLNGIDPFKIPVLYEHEQPARFIPFGRPPTDMLFSETIQKYVGIVAAAYGLNISDLGIYMSSGGSLAASIRNERQTRRTGIGTAISKVENFWNKILPSYLRFKYQVQDEEEIVAIGRARATNIMAFSSAIQSGMMTPQDAINQLKADNLIDVDIEAPQPQGLPNEYGQQPQQPPQYGQPDPYGGNAAQETTDPDSLGIEDRMDDVPASQGGVGGPIQYRSETMNNADDNGEMVVMIGAA